MTESGFPSLKTEPGRSEGGSEMTVTELDTKDIVTMSVIDNGQEDGTYKGEHSAFWEG